MIEFLLRAPDERLAALRAQLETAVVTGKCDCGCPTIDLAVDRSLTPAGLGRATIEADLRENAFRDPEQTDGLILFLDDGYLSSLEQWSVSDDPPSSFQALSNFSEPKVVTFPDAE